MKKINPIWYVLLVAFVVRLLLPFFAITLTQDYKVFHASDTNSYMKLAVNLISSGQFTRNGSPEIIRTPGYPLLLIFGILSGNVELVTIALQVVLSCLTVYLVYKITLLLFEKPKLAVLGAFLYALEPLSILYTSKILAETLFTCLNVVFLYYLVKYMKHRSLNELFVSAIVLSASVYIRPINYFLPIIMTMVLLLWILTKKQKKSVLFIHILGFFLVSMGLISLWQIRNRIETGYSGFAAITDINLYFYQGASVFAVRQGIPYYEMQDKMGYRDEEIYFLNHPEQRTWTSSERFRYMRKEGLRVISENPFTYLKIHLKGMIRVLLDPGATEYLKLFKLYPESGGLLGDIVDKGWVKMAKNLFRKKPLVFWSNSILALILGLYLLLGVIALLSKDFICKMLIITVLTLGIYFLVISGGPHSLNRFRHPIMPLLCILGGNGVSIFIGKLRKNKTKGS